MATMETVIPMSFRIGWKFVSYAFKASVANPVYPKDLLLKEEQHQPVVWTNGHLQLKATKDGEFIKLEVNLPICPIDLGGGFCVNQYFDTVEGELYPVWCGTATKFTGVLKIVDGELQEVNSLSDRSNDLSFPMEDYEEFGILKPLKKLAGL